MTKSLKISSGLKIPFIYPLVWCIAVFFLFQSSGGWAGQDLQNGPNSLCQRLLLVQQAEVRRYTTPDFFGVEVPAYDYSFEGSLSRGVLSISAFLSYPDLGVRSHLSGDLLYQEMMEHFGSGRIHTIKGVWYDGTNYDRFFELLDQGYSKEEAALGTWSGRQAQKYGFTRVAVIEIRKYDGLNGTSVYAEFVRDRGLIIDHLD